METRVPGSRRSAAVTGSATFDSRSFRRLSRCPSQISERPLEALSVHKMRYQPIEDLQHYSPHVLTLLIVVKRPVSIYIESWIISLSDTERLMVVPFAVFWAEPDDQLADTVKSKFALQHSVHLVFECLRFGINTKALP